MRTVIQPPAEEAITLARAKVHLRIEDDELDAEGEALLRDGIEAVRQMAEGELLRPLLPQTCLFRADRLSHRLRLWNDVTAVTEVRYRDINGVDQLFPLVRCTVEGARTLVLIGDLPSDATAVRVTFTCGAWADPASVPSSVVRWMLLHLGSLSEIRQTVTYAQTFAVPGLFVARLLDPFRCVEI